jgi:hypothetical protein
MAATDTPIRVLVLEEFRLHAEDVDGAAARIVAATSSGIEPAIPLLTSIADPRDVATIRGLHAGEPDTPDAAQHAALDPLVRSWASPKHYGPRITERAERAPSSFRLAVTESGINGQGPAPVTLGDRSAEDNTTSRAVGLVWVGAPIGTQSGLLVLLGSYYDPLQADADSFGWRLPLSRDLGVRIYENRPT